MLFQQQQQHTRFAEHARDSHNTQQRIQRRNVGRWTLDVGRWTLDVGRWTLDVGRWTLDVGRWEGQ